MKAILRVVSGPDQGREFSLAEGEHVCGRDPSNTICLSDRTASRAHFKLQVLGDRVILVDLGSRNTTLVNGDPVREWRLRRGDRVGVGATELEVDFPGAPPAAVEAPRTTVECTLSGKADLLDRIRRQKVPAEFERVRGALTLLCDFAGKAPSATSAEDLFVGLLEHAMKGTGAERAFVALAAKGKKDLVVAASRDYAGRPLGPSDRPSASLVAQVVRERVSLLVSDRTSPRQSATGKPLRSLLLAPLADGTRALGVVQLDAEGKVQEFDEEDLRFLAAICHLGGLALANLRMAEELRQENRNLREAVLAESGMVGLSTALRQVHRAALKAAAVDSPVLVQGESGTGKELVASAVHYNSVRKGKPFVCVNCGALTETLLESELFGHEKGAFTGADKRKIGRFEQADGGTLFLDEVGEMSPACQVKFLRVLETGEFTRVGGTEQVRVDVRVVAATHRDLDALIKAGRFREDLFFRLGVLGIKVPPLRERKDDILLLADHFLARFREKVGRRVTGWSDAAREALLHHRWPGNIRELKNAVERAVAMGEGEVVGLEDLPASVRRAPSPEGQTWPTLAQVEEDYLRKVLEHTGGNKSKAAEILGIERSTLYKKLS